MNNFFTHRNMTEGKVGIGKLPNIFQDILDSISTEYFDMIPVAKKRLSLDSYLGACERG